jgi:hypothetical protein
VEGENFFYKVELTGTTQEEFDALLGKTWICARSGRVYGDDDKMEFVDNEVVLLVRRVSAPETLCIVGTVNDDPGITTLVVNSLNRGASMLLGEVRQHLLHQLEHEITPYETQAVLKVVLEHLEEKFK